MKGIDTNILVRFLVGDDELQAQKVYKLFKSVESDKNEVFVLLLVVLELIWVLESVYEIARSESKILDSISELLLMQILKFEHQSALQQCIRFAYDNNYDLSDLLTAYSANEQGCTSVLTFDKKGSKHPIFELAK